MIQFSAIPGMKPLSCPSQFIFWQQQRVVKNNFQEKELSALSHKCSTLGVFVRPFVAAAATVYQEPHFWRTEGQELLHLCKGEVGWLATHSPPRSAPDYMIPFLIEPLILFVCVFFFLFWLNTSSRSQLFCMLFRCIFLHAHFTVALLYKLALLQCQHYNQFYRPDAFHQLM